MYVYDIKCLLLYQKPKSLVGVGRGGLTLLFFLKVVKYIEVRGDKSFTSRSSRPAENNAKTLVGI